MAYDVITYMRCQNIPELERRFTNLEPLVRVYSEEYGLIQNVLANPEYGHTRLKEIGEKLDDLKQDMQNIITAIKALSS